MCIAVMFVGEHGPAGQDHAVTSEEEHCTRQTKTGPEFPAEAPVHG